MQKTLDQYLMFFESFSLNEPAHWSLHRSFLEKDHQLHWNRKNSKSWEICYGTEKSEALRYQREELIKYLKKEKFDTVQLMNSMERNIKSIVIISDILQDQAKQLLGAKAIEESRVQFKRFTEELSTIIRTSTRGIPNMQNMKSKDLPKKTRPNLKLIKTEPSDLRN